MNYSASNPDNTIFTFGLLKGAIFSANVSTTEKTRFHLLLVESHEKDHVSKSGVRLRQQCLTGASTMGVCKIEEFAGRVLQFNWNIEIEEDGVYDLHLVNCGGNGTTYEISVCFGNPGSFIDSRDFYLPEVYRVLATAQFLFLVIWVVNGLQFMNFRIPLHTMFVLLPMIRCVSLWITASRWEDLKSFDESPCWKLYIQLGMEFSYYALLFTGIAMASAGFGTFRLKLENFEALELVVSSACLSAGIFITHVKPVFSWVLCGVVWTLFSGIWYLKHSVLNLAMATDILNIMRKDPQVYAKVKLSRSFFISSLLIVAGTLFFETLAAGMNFRRMVCYAIFEAGLLTGALVQLHFFMFRQGYSGLGDALEAEQISRFFPVIVEPKRAYVACITAKLQ